MKKIYLIIVIQLFFANSMYAQDYYYGEIRLFAFGIVPAGWIECNGQLLPISQNTALFSILGTTYGGNGTTTFALPNLNGKMVVGQGEGQGLSPVYLGQSDGYPNIRTLTQGELPTHSHQVAVKVSSSVGSTSTPTATTSIGAPVQIFNGTPRVVTNYNQATPDIPLQNQTISVSSTGVSQPIKTQHPILAGNYCIAAQGIFPPRN